MRKQSTHPTKEPERTSRRIVSMSSPIRRRRTILSHPVTRARLIPAKPIRNRHLSLCGRQDGGLPRCAGSRILTFTQQRAKDGALAPVLPDTTSKSCSKSWTVMFSGPLERISFSRWLCSQPLLPALFSQRCFSRSYLLLSIPRFWRTTSSRRLRMPGRGCC